MKTVLEQIKSVREDGLLNITISDKNRYLVDVNEEDGSKTAYLIGVPVFNDKSGDLVNKEFKKENDKFLFNGSNSTILACEKGIEFHNEFGDVFAEMNLNNLRLNDGKLTSDNFEITPTFNGVRIMQTFSDALEANIDFIFKEEVDNVNDNSKYVGFMFLDFMPFSVISLLGVTDKYENILESGSVTYSKLEDKKYRVRLASSAAHENARFVYEINLHETKLFQDTTVESKHAFENNVYGGSAYIGESETFGEQWLYTKLDYSILFQSTILNIDKVSLYIPRYGGDIIDLIAVCLNRRFCSFGSNWDGKVTDEGTAINSSVYGEYYKFDITDFIVESSSRKFDYFSGFIIRAKTKSKKFTAISTGDNCAKPQFLEVKYK